MTVVSQGHANMEDWPELIYNVATYIQQSGASDSHLPVGGTVVDDPQLFHCFQNLSMAARHVHKSNFLYNFAVIGLVLYYLLKVCGTSFYGQGLY